MGLSSPPSRYLSGDQKFGASAADHAGGPSRGSDQQFSTSRGSASGGSGESEAHGSEVDEPAAATCNGSVYPSVAGRLKRGGVKCPSAIDAFADQLVWKSLTVYRLASSVSFFFFFPPPKASHQPPPPPPPP